MIEPQTSPGPDNQTRALVGAAYLIGILAAIGPELRLLMMREAVWWPFLLLAAVVMTSWFVHGFREGGRTSGAILRFRNRKRRVSLRSASEGLSTRVADISREMGLMTTPSVKIIPNTWSVCDAYACGNTNTPQIVLTSGAKLLSERKDPDNIAQFRFLISHETAHLLAKDPEIIGETLAIMTVAASVLALKVVVILIAGIDRAARWYEPFLPRSFTWQQETNLLLQIPAHPSIALFGVFSINILLLGALFVVTWMIIRRREYWADYIALCHALDHAVSRDAMRTLLGGPRLKASLPQAARGWKYWHPSPKARVRSAERKITKRAWYSWTAALVAIPALFLVRYILGNSTGFSSEMPVTTFVMFASTGYYAAAFTIVYWLVFPSQQASRIRVLRSAMDVVCVTVPVTVAVAFADQQWTLAHSVQNLPQDYVKNIWGEIHERAFLIAGIGTAVILCGIVVVAGKLISSRFPSWALALISLGLLFLVSNRIGASLVSETRADMLPKPRLSDTLGRSRTREQVCDDQRRGTSEFTHGLARLPGGILEFRPPVDAFFLNRGPAGALTAFDERKLGMAVVHRENVLGWFERTKSRHKDLAADRYHLLEAYGKIVSGNRGSSLRSIENLARGEQPTAAQRKALNEGLLQCAQNGTFTCLRLALALGADPQAVVEDPHQGKMGPLEAIVRNRPFSNFIDECTYFRLLTLLSAGADPNEDCVLPRVVHHWDLRSTVALLRHGADPGRIHSDGRSALHAVFGNASILTNPSDTIPVLTLLLRSRPNPNRQDTNGETPMMMAAALGQMEAVAALLAAGGDPNIRDMKGLTAADHALGRQLQLDLSNLPARRRIVTLLNRHQ